jgi:pimeloyl-ACP methyl ester carboxylesterase
MTKFLDIEGGRIAYDVAGEGPLIVLSHGIGDRRQAFRFLVPELVRAGFRVAAADMRGHGESSLGDWKSISRTCPALVIMGTEDPDWADPRAEAEGIVAAMPAGLGRVAMIKGAGHYPHAQCPDEVARLITSFFRERVLA